MIESLQRNRMSSRRFLSFYSVLFFTFCMINYTACKRSSSGFSNILNTKKAKCTEKQMKITEEKMVRMLAYGPKGRPFPSSLEEQKQFCDETLRLSRQIEAFSKECFKPEIHNMISVFQYSVKSTMVRNYCGKNIKKNLPYIKASACLNRYVFSNYRCFDIFNNQTRTLVNVKADDKKIPFTCCNFNKFMKCLSDLFDAHSCSAPLRDDFLTIIRGSTAGLMNIGCGEYTEETDRCQSLGPPPSAPNRKQYNSFSLALIDLVASMESFNIAT